MHQTLKSIGIQIKGDIMNKLIAIMFLFILSACQNEESCYRSIQRQVTDRSIATAVLIYQNDDMNICDYTVLGGTLVRR